MFNRVHGLGIGLGAVIFAAGIWLGSIDRTAAEGFPPGGGQNMRFLLTAANDGSIFMVDSASGDTWTLTPQGVDAKSLRQWSRLHSPDRGTVRERTP